MTSDRRTGLVLTIPAPGRAELTEYWEEPLADGRFRVDTVFSGLSAGTELTWFRGTNPYLRASWDSELGVFRADRPAARYPIERLGYMEVARVRESRTAAVSTGELLAMTYGHRTSYDADPLIDRFVRLPAELDPVLGVFVAHMGPICANGLLHAAADAVGSDVRSLGDGVRGRDVLVTGAGVVGLLTALFAAEHGAARVAVLDATPARLATVAALGLEPVDERDGDVARSVKERWAHGPGDRGASVVFQCRGQPGALATALRCLRPQGTVVDLAFYTAGADEVRLGEEFHHNGLTVRCAQISRVPRGLAHTWDRPRLAAETIALLESRGGDVRTHVVTDVVPFAEAPGLLADLSERRRHALAAVFAMPN